MTWEPIDVHTEQPYQVLIGNGVATLLPGFLDGVQRVAVIHPKSLTSRLPEITAALDLDITAIRVPDAEKAKTPKTLVRCWETLAEAGFTRSDAIVGFGGGATTDLAGFVAATWLRGVRYVAIPTSILAMVDAAVGGKTGINLPAGKNLVGSFYEPFTVLCDLDFIGSLPPGERSSGLAEVIKAGFIGDPVILDAFAADPDSAMAPGSPSQADLIRRAVAVKAGVVSADLRERTSQGRDIGREALNYGHTLGHAIERHQGYKWRHGEAISVGMVFAAELARRLDLIDDDLVARHRSLLRAAGLPTGYRADAWPALREAMNLDKKSRGSSLRFVVLEGVGRPAIVVGPAEDVLVASYQAVVEEES